MGGGRLASDHIYIYIIIIYTLNYTNIYIYIYIYIYNQQITAPSTVVQQVLRPPLDGRPADIRPSVDGLPATRRLPPLWFLVGFLWFCDSETIIIVRYFDDLASRRDLAGSGRRRDHRKPNTSTTTIIFIRYFDTLAGRRDLAVSGRRGDHRKPNRHQGTPL